MFRLAPIRVGVLLAVLVCSGTTRSQDNQTPLEPAEGRVVGKIWHTRVDFSKSFEYLNRVREELEIAQSPVMVMMTGRANFAMPGMTKSSGEAAPVELKGTLIFLQTKPTVDLTNPISFQLIGTEDAFHSFVQQQKESMGPAAELIGDGDRYEVRLDFSKLMAAAPIEASNSEDAAEGDKKPRVQRSFSIVIKADAGGDGSGAKDASGKPSVVGNAPKAMSTFYRYVDGIMYSCRSSALHSVDLPDQEGLKLPEDGTSDDLYADFDFTRIPAPLKTTFWTALESQASVWLQRFDNEAAGDYSFRRAVSEGRLELVKAVLFDVDRARFSLNLSPDGTTPIKSKLRINARENSPLAATLESLSNHRTQLASLQDEQSPLVVSSSFSLPEILRPVAASFFGSLGLKLKEAASETPGAEVLIDDLIKPLQDSAMGGMIDSAFCLRGQVETGLVPCGAIRMENAELFLSSLEPLLQVTSANRRLVVSREQIGDYRMISLRAEKAAIPLAGKQLPVQMNLVATGSWLWMTVGDSRAITTLEELVTNSEQTLEQSGQATPLLVRLQLSKWLGTTDDELSKVPQLLLTEFERWLNKTTAPNMSISINGSATKTQTNDSAGFTSYAARALKPESSEFELRVRTAGQELVADATIGTSLSRFAVAQFLDAQSRMFKNLSIPGVSLPAFKSPDAAQ